jgi:hypothetical protein
VLHAKCPNGAGRVAGALLRGMKRSPAGGAALQLVDPNFLESCMGHFYEQGPGGNWVEKQKRAFLQARQDFYNSTPLDALDQVQRAVGTLFMCGAAPIAVAYEVASPLQPNEVRLQLVVRHGAGDLATAAMI